MSYLSYTRKLSLCVVLFIISNITASVQSLKRRILRGIVKRKPISGFFLINRLPRVKNGQLVGVVV
jgi:hypothetical protein